MTTSEIHELLDGWAAAETAGDTTAMASLVTDDFSAIGPLGFTLDRDRTQEARLGRRQVQLRDAPGELLGRVRPDLGQQEGAGRRRLHEETVPLDRRLQHEHRYKYERYI